MKVRGAFPMMMSILALGVGTGGCDSRESGCEATRTAVPLDEGTPLGFSGAELLAHAEGSYAGTLTWMAVDPNLIATNATPGETTLNLSIVRTGEAHFVDQENRGDTDISCSDSLEAAVEVQALTADGALAESWPGLVRGSAPGGSTLEIELQGRRLTGALRAEVVSASGMKMAFFSFAGGFIEGAGGPGSIRIGLEGREGDVVYMPPPTPLATWTALARTPPLAP